MKSLQIMVFISFLLGCNADTEDSGEFSNSTTDASELFFNNMRKSYYAVQEMKDAGMNIYLNKDFNQEDAISMSIIHNWRNDEASVMLDIKGIDLPANFLVGSNPIQTVSFEGRSIDEHIEVAIELYKAIINSEDLSIRSDSGSVQLSDPLRETIRVTMVDFFNLTDNQKFVKRLTND